MSVPRPASEFVLGSDGRARLAALLAMEEFRVREACGRVRLNSNACALAFVYAQEHDLPLVTYASLLSADVREAQRRAPERELFMWEPGDWDHWDFSRSRLRTSGRSQSVSLPTFSPRDVRIRRGRSCLTSPGDLPAPTGQE